MEVWVTVQFPQGMVQFQTEVLASTVPEDWRGSGTRRLSEFGRAASDRARQMLRLDPQAQANRVIVSMSRPTLRTQHSRSPEPAAISVHARDRNEVLAAAAEDEPLFVLRAQDRTAVPTILHWARLAEKKLAPKQKLAGAYSAIAAFLSWQADHDTKDPD